VAQQHDFRVVGVLEERLQQVEAADENDGMELQNEVLEAGDGVLAANTRWRQHVTVD
jgi:hypothetical protein